MACSSNVNLNTCYNATKSDERIGHGQEFKRQIFDRNSNISGRFDIDTPRKPLTYIASGYRGRRLTRESMQLRCDKPAEKAGGALGERALLTRQWSENYRIVVGCYAGIYEKAQALHVHANLRCGNDFPNVEARA